MEGNLDLRNTAMTSVLAGILSGLATWIFIQIPTVSASIGVIPIANNIFEIVSIVLGVSVAAVAVEWYEEKDLYNDKEVVVGAFIISLTGILTVGLGVPPFSVRPVWIAIILTVMLESFLFTWFVLPYARSFDFI